MSAQYDLLYEILTDMIGASYAVTPEIERHILALCTACVYRSQGDDAPGAPDRAASRVEDGLAGFTRCEIVDLAADVRRADRITFCKDSDDRFGGDATDLSARCRKLLAAALDAAALAAPGAVQSVVTQHILMETAVITSPAWTAGIGVLAQRATVALDAAGHPVRMQIHRVIGPATIVRGFLDRFLVPCEPLPILVKSAAEGGRDFRCRVVRMYSVGPCHQSVDMRLGEDVDLELAPLPGEPPLVEPE